MVEIDTPRWAHPLLRPARYKGAYGGRGSGKSHFFAEVMIESHVLDLNRRSVCIREHQKSLAQSVKRLLEIKIEKMELGDFFEVQQAVIKNKYGSGLIIFQGMQNHTAESIKSLEGYDCAWVEEAQSLSQRSLDLLRPTIRKARSELWFSWNPRFKTDPIDVFLREGRQPPDATVVKSLYDDNPWFPEVLRRELEYDKQRDIDKYKHIWLGEYVSHSSARIFKDWRVEEFDTPGNVNLLLGADWGYASSPTALVRCYIVGRQLFIDYEAYQVGCDIVDTPNLFLTVPGAEKWPIVADSSRPETIAHMRKHGFPKIFPAVKGKGSIEDGISFLQGYDIVVHPRCKHTIDELSLYSWKIDPKTDEVLPEVEDDHNHIIDALRYACEGARRIQSTARHTTTKSVPTATAWQRH